MNGCIYLNISNCRIYMDLVFIREKTNLVMWKKTKVFDREVLAATISQTGIHLKYAYFSNEFQLQYSYIIGFTLLKKSLLLLWFSNMTLQVILIPNSFSAIGIPS